MLLSNEFSPDVRVEKEAIALAEAGYGVRIIAWDRRGSGVVEQKEMNFSIRRLQAGRFKRKEGLLIGFPLFGVLSLIQGLREGYDVVHSHDLDTLFQGVLLSKLKGVPLVYDAHEHYALMIEQDLPHWIARFVDKLELAIVGNVDLVIAANVKIAEYLAPRSKKMAVVMNCAEVTNHSSARERGRDGPLTLFYAGSLEPLRYIEELMHSVSNHEGLELRIAGTGSLQGQVEAMAKVNPNIRYSGRLTREEVANEVANADAIIALLDPSNGNNRIGTPNRLFEAMVAGVPVLVSAGTLSAEIVQECGCGIVLDWSQENFMKAIDELKVERTEGKMAERGLNASKRYNWDRMRRVLIDAYRGMFGQ